MKFKINFKSNTFVLRIAVYALAILYVFFMLYAREKRDIKRTADLYAREYAMLIQEKLNSSIKITRTIGHSFESYQSMEEKSRRPAFDAFLQNEIAKNEDYVALWTLWEPNSLDKLDTSYAGKPGNTHSGNFAPVYYKRNGIMLHQNGDESALSTSELYELPKRSREETVFKPSNTFIGGSSEKIQTASVVYPIIRNGSFQGVVSADIDLKPLLETINSFHPYNNSYAFLFSDDGTIFAHQEIKYIGKSIENVGFEEQEKVKILDKIKNGEPFASNFTDEDKNISNFTSFAPIALGKTSSNWGIAIIIPRKSVFIQTIQNWYILLITSILGFVVLFYLSRKMSSENKLPLIETTRVLGAMSLGDLNVAKINEATRQNENTEIGEIAKSVNKLINGLNNTTNFANEIGKGNLDAHFELLSEKDILGKSLLDMRESLQAAKQHESERKVEDEKRNWATNGIAKFSEILRQNNDNIKELSYHIISNLVDYLGANQGGLFLVNDEEENDQFIELEASCAFSRRKFHQKRFEPGEGLIGRCILEQKIIFMKDIPNEYIEITSGLGGANPSCLLLVPLKLNDKTYGVLEIASFKEIEQYQIEFVEKLGETIASTISNVRINVSTSALLEKFQQQAEEMKAQEEELRQNLEELQSTQEEMERIKQEELQKTKGMMKTIEDNQRLLQDIIEKIPANVFLKDENGIFLIANSAVAEKANTTIDHLIGTSDFDHYPQADAQKYRNKELEIMAKGEESFIEENTLNGKTRYVRSTKSPFFISTSGKTGLLGFQIDVTDLKSLEKELSVQNEELQKSQDSYLKEKYLIDALMNNIPDSIYFKDLDSRFIRVSKYQQNKFNQGVEIIGKTDFDLFSNEHSQQAFNDEQRIIKTGEPIIDLVEKETFEDGRVEWVSTTKMPLKDTEGKTIGTFGVSRNITSSKKLELLAKQHADILEVLINSLPVIVYETDYMGNITEFKGKGLKSIKKSEKEFKGKSIYSIYPQIDSELFKALKDKESIKFEESVENEGKTYKLQHSVFTHNVINGGLIGFAFEI